MVPIASHSGSISPSDHKHRESMEALSYPSAQYNQQRSYDVTRVYNEERGEISTPENTTLPLEFSAQINTVPFTHEI